MKHGVLRNTVAIGHLQLSIHLVQNRHVGTQKSHWEQTYKGNYTLKLCLPFVGFAPVRRLCPNIAVLYNVNGKLQRAYCIVQRKEMKYRTKIEILSPFPSSLPSFSFVRSLFRSSIPRNGLLFLKTIGKPFVLHV